MLKLRTAFILLICALPLMGCDTNDGPAEELGERVDDAGDRTAEGIENAADNVEDEYEDARN